MKFLIVALALMAMFSTASGKPGMCYNWFGNNLDWSKIPYQPFNGHGPWGLTPNGCTKDVKKYGKYSCVDESMKPCRAPTPDCKDGKCVAAGGGSPKVKACPVNQNKMVPGVCLCGPQKQKCMPKTLLPTGYYGSYCYEREGVVRPASYPKCPFEQPSPFSGTCGCFGRGCKTGQYCTSYIHRGKERGRCDLKPEGAKNDDDDLEIEYVKHESNFCQNHNQEDMIIPTKGESEESLLKRCQAHCNALGEKCAAVRITTRGGLKCNYEDKCTLKPKSGVPSDVYMKHVTKVVLKYEELEHTFCQNNNKEDTLYAGKGESKDQLQKRCADHCNQLGEQCVAFRIVTARGELKCNYEDKCTPKLKAGAPSTVYLKQLTRVQIMPSTVQSEEYVADQFEEFDVDIELGVGELSCPKKRAYCFKECKMAYDTTPQSQLSQMNKVYRECRQKCRDVYNCSGGSTEPKVNFKGMVRSRCGDKIGALNACMGNGDHTGCRSAVRARFAPCENAVRQEIAKMKRARLGLIHEEAAVGRDEELELEVSETKYLGRGKNPHFMKCREDRLSCFAHCKKTGTGYGTPCWATCVKNFGKCQGEALAKGPVPVPTESSSSSSSSGTGSKKDKNKKSKKKKKGKKKKKTADEEMWMEEEFDVGTNSENTGFTFFGLFKVAFLCAGAGALGFAFAKYKNKMF